jgi:hypothetical protein
MAKRLLAQAGPIVFRGVTDVRRCDHVRDDDQPAGSAPTRDDAQEEQGKAQTQQVGLTMNDLAPFLERLGRMEASLAVLVERQTVKDWYTTEEAAKTFGKAEHHTGMVPVGR